MPQRAPPQPKGTLLRMGVRASSLETRSCMPPFDLSLGTFLTQPATPVSMSSRVGQAASLYGRGFHFAAFYTIV